MNLRIVSILVIIGFVSLLPFGLGALIFQGLVVLNSWGLQLRGFLF